MFSHRSRILAVVAAVVLLVSVHSVRAEDLAGNVQGVVKSASGQALPGAYVKLINAEKRLTFMAVSQAQGRYTMNNLPPGELHGAGYWERLPEQAHAGGFDGRQAGDGRCVADGYARACGRRMDGFGRPGASPATNWIPSWRRRNCRKGQAKRLWKPSATNAISCTG